MLDLQSFKGFTPGPWRRVGRTIFPLGETSLCIALAEQHRKECAANATLIAAAPDLLALAIKQEAEIKRLREALDFAHVELAALIPLPQSPLMDHWPCDNPADRQCLQAAYEKIVQALEPTHV